MRRMGRTGKPVLIMNARFMTKITSSDIFPTVLLPAEDSNQTFFQSNHFMLTDFYARISALVDHNVC